MDSFRPLIALPFLGLISRMLRNCSPLEPLCSSPYRFGGISVGGVNSQVRLTEEEIETTLRDLRNLLGPFLVRENVSVI